ncbi:hypothetical protein PT974_03161 [Cladobotryum mycophilum]|uniref:RGS domain-containing protein n=1 Tax=Cladobotryum mycophilum TaxID=491253 RepID=A0ABR0SRM3_9HYPO
MGSELGITPDTKPEIVITKVGIWWICWASIWTAMLVAGMAFLIYKRNTPVLRIRGIGLSLGAVTLLHLYWISVQLGLTLGPKYPGDLQFWIMGTYLPIGIGLFHASNARFLHVAQKQKQFAERHFATSALPEPKPKPTGIVGRFRNLDYTSKVFALVGVGMAFQLFLTVFMYCISRKYHGSWGIPGTEVHGTEMEKKTQMGRGWEWWPSVLWLFFWAWIVAPYTLWKSRNIRDTQGWRIQTIGSAIATLHAAPMWLIALYAPGFDKINSVWIPPQWIAISIWFLEILTIFLPCWEVIRHQNLKEETLATIAQWEAKNTNVKRNKSIRSSHTAVGSTTTGWRSVNGSVNSTSDESVFTMSALEYVLEKNPEPLQKFSALRDFSGENIAFLTSVSEWKSMLPNDLNMSDEARRELVRERFNRALRIYKEFISSQDAEFPINLSSSQHKKLEAIFEGSARIMYGVKEVVDPITPFDPTKWDRSKYSGSSAGSNSETVKVSSDQTSSIGDRVQYWGTIPESFDGHVFDDAEKAIKYLVLTNTWPKFVRDRRSSVVSLDSQEAGHVTLPVTKEEAEE